jgi:LacI family transcriptional regulator
MKIKVSDIAKKAGVSSGTVSNALNNRKGIGKEKRDEILKIAHEMGYFKKSGGETHTLRFVVLNKEAHVVDDTPFFSELIRGIETQSSLLGYELLITHISIDNKEKSLLDEILKYDLVDGMVILGTEMEQTDLDVFRHINIPLVIVDAAFRNQEFDFVAINNTDGAYEIVEHLIQNGHEKIGLINSIYQINNFRERKLGYQQALINHQLSVYQEFEALVEPNPEGAYNDMIDYLKAMIAEGSALPTAFFAVNDNIALGALKAFRELKIKSSIVGFDDLPICEYCNPPLTTVRVNKIDLGRKTINRLVEIINDQDQSKLKILIGTDIVKRESVEKLNK